MSADSAPLSGVVKARALRFESDPFLPASFQLLGSGTELAVFHNAFTKEGRKRGGGPRGGKGASPELPQARRAFKTPKAGRRASASACPLIGRAYRKGAGERAASVIVGAVRDACEAGAPERRRASPGDRPVAPGRLVGVGRGWKTGLPLAPAGLRAAAAVPRACRAAVPPSRWRPSPEPRRPLRALSFPLFCRFAGGVVMAQRAFPNPYADYNKSLAECYFDSTGRVS